MSDISKERQLSLVEKEKSAGDIAAPRPEKPRQTRGDRASKFCYQPGEMRLIKKNTK